LEHKTPAKKADTEAENKWKNRNRKCKQEVTNLKN